MFPFMISHTLNYTFYTGAWLTSNTLFLVPFLIKDIYQMQWGTFLDSTEVIVAQF